MQGIYKSFDRLLRPPLEAAVASRQSVLLLGPRQVGKTTLMNALVEGRTDVIAVPLQDAQVRLELERDPSLLGRRVAAARARPTVFIDEIQKVPELLDQVQLLIDRRQASFLLTGSSARKLRRAGANLLPGRIKAYHLDPLTWPELGWAGDGRLQALAIPRAVKAVDYSFDDALVYGSLPGIVAHTPADRREFLEAYGRIYLDEEIRAEALVRKMSPFSRFVELAARESGTAPNLTKLSMESGTSVTSIKSYYEILEDTLVVERVEPYLKNARKRLLATPRYYFFDLGVRNAVARLPLEPGLIAAQKGLLFEHAVMLELIRRVRALRRNYRVHFWRTAGGAEVDCVIDTGNHVVPIEIKAARRVRVSDVAGLVRFLGEYRSVARQGYVVTMGTHAEKLADNVLSIPWTEL
jgi:predicted AAA+ superfamily ATPase